MISADPNHIAALRRLVSSLADRSYVPYSGRAEAALLLLSDGGWIPGVRVENASFSLTMPPLLNAWTSAVALGRTDVVAIILSRPYPEAEVHYASKLPSAAAAPFASESPSLDDLIQQAPDILASEALPKLRGPVSPFLSAETPLDAAATLALARTIAQRAFVPESNYHVGCIIELEDGRLVPGVNVEHEDWLHIVCAERNALGTCASYQLGSPRAVYLSVPNDDRASPCGACRQWLVELAPSAELWMDRGKQAPAFSTPSDLLPDSFSGEGVHRPPVSNSPP